MPRRYSKSSSRFVEKEMSHRKHLKHGRMSRKQAIAIGLSKARRAGKKVPAKS
jgi:hypothetical protein